MMVRCHCTECKHNYCGYCYLHYIDVVNSQMTAVGMLPLCTDYEEDDDDNGTD